ncbi:MAG TPA: hypothetical protein VEX68_30070 [Bryobacteraceae bacterium]|nr:hypothetical protein [Bryobacteraceae bacterium]
MPIYLPAAKISTLIPPFQLAGKTTVLSNLAPQAAPVLVAPLLVLVILTCPCQFGG